MTDVVNDPKVTSPEEETSKHTEAGDMPSKNAIDRSEGSSDDKNNLKRGLEQDEATEENVSKKQAVEDNSTQPPKNETAHTLDVASPALASTPAEPSTTLPSSSDNSSTLPQAFNCSSYLPPMFDASTEITLKLLIPSRQVGTVIGKAGATINQMRTMSDTKVNVSNEGGIFGDDRPVTITGTFPAICCAFGFLLGLVSAPPQGVDTPLNDMTVTVKLLVPHNKTGGLIGKQGSTIQALRAQSGADLKVHNSKETPAGSTERVMVVSGSLETVQAAQALITSKLLEIEPSGSAVVGGGAGGGGGGGNMHMNMNMAGGMGGMMAGMGGGGGGNKVDVHVPDEYMGRVIGKGGAAVAEIRQQSGAHIEIHKREMGSPLRLVTLSGSPDQIQMAQYLISLKMTDQQQQQQQMGGAGGAPQGGFGAGAGGGFAPDVGGYGYGGAGAGYPGAGAGGYGQTGQEAPQQPRPYY